MSEHDDLAEARPTRPLRYTMRGDAARTVILLYAAGDGNDLHGEIVAELRPPFAGSGGGPTSEEWRAFVESLVGAWNDAGLADAALSAARREGAAEAYKEASELMHAASLEQVKAGDDAGAVALTAGALVIEGHAQLKALAEREVRT